MTSPSVTSTRVSIPAHEPHNATAGQGPVLVDVDDDHGALVLLASGLLGAEIELSREGAAGMRTHVAVLARRLGRGLVQAAVYPSLRAGRWFVHDPDDDIVVLVVDVPGGVVTQAHWPGGVPVQQAAG